MDARSLPGRRQDILEVLGTGSVTVDYNDPQVDIPGRVIEVLARLVTIQGALK